jgi:hypothetical protein
MALSLFLNGHGMIVLFRFPTNSILTGLAGLLGLALPQIIFAQSEASRKDMQDYYIDYQRGHRTIYQSVPVTQVVPSFNTITYAGLYESTEATVTELNGIEKEELKMTGYRAAPYLSIALKKFGLGFSGETGRRKLAYDYSMEFRSRSQTSGQFSDVEHRGFGLYVYWIVPGVSTKNVKTTLTLGNNAYAVKHNFSDFTQNTTSSSLESGELQRSSYNLVKNDLGLNIGIKLLKKFTLIPWINYERMDTSEAQRKSDEFAAAGQSSHATTLSNDVETLWHARSPTQYGIDFSIRIFDSTEIHLGGLLGQFAALTPKADHVEDKSVTLTIAVDQKGN